MAMLGVKQTCRFRKHQANLTFRMGSQKRQADKFFTKQKKCDFECQVFEFCPCLVYKLFQTSNLKDKTGTILFASRST